jgi:hypothetical protein
MAMAAIKQPDAMKAAMGLVVAGLVLTGLCTGAWFMWQDRYWIAQDGPTEVTLEQLTKLENPSQLPSPWVKVTFEKIVDTGVEMLEVGPGVKTVDYKFLLVQAGDRWMVATVPENFQGNTLAGEIYHSTNPEDIGAFVEIHKSMQEVHGGRMFPFEFRADIDFGENWSYFAYLVGGFGAAGLLLVGMGIYSFIQGFREPSNLPGGYAEMGNPWEEEVKQELEESRV